jgi:ParB family transcriptional regulator, chromosome partitioning protein
LDRNAASGRQCDAEQFFALQREAVEELVKHHESSAAWVEVTQHHSITDWQYRKARKNQKGGVLINLSPSGRVEIREGLAKTKIGKETAEAVAENPAAPAKSKAAHSKALCQTVAHHKTAAVAAVVLLSPRAAQEVMIVRMLKDFSPHGAFRSLAKESDPQGAYRVLEDAALRFAGRFGFAVEDGEKVWDVFPPPFTARGIAITASSLMEKAAAPTARWSPRPKPRASTTRKFRS